MFSILSGILHLGNLVFDGDVNKNDEAFIVDGVNNEHLKAVAKLLQIPDIDAINNSLITKSLKTGGDIMIIPISKQNAIKTRDSLVMAIYDELFKWIVQNVNKSLQENLMDVDDDEENQSNLYHIGILDIFGFECFKQNLFEQFCINHANEKLQYQFNQNIFELEQIEYQNEGIDIEHIHFDDNLKCIELVEKGVFDILDEETKINGDDASFKLKIDKKFAKNEYYSINVKHKNVFTIHHYAGSVHYNTDGFVEKTKNTLMVQLVDLMKQSKLKILKHLFESSQNQKNKRAKHSERLLLRI